MTINAQTDAIKTSLIDSYDTYFFVKLDFMVLDYDSSHSIKNIVSSEGYMRHNDIQI